MAPGRALLAVAQLLALHALLASALPRDDWHEDIHEVSTRFNSFFQERADRLKALKDAEVDAVQGHIAVARASAEAVKDQVAVAHQAIAVHKGVHGAPPSCIPSPVPYVAYTVGNLGGRPPHGIGQNGWYVAPDDSSPLPYGPRRPAGQQSISDAAAHQGRQSWQAGGCGKACNATVYVTYPGPQLGGFGPGAVGKPNSGAPANRYRNTLWVRTYASYGGALTPNTVLEVVLSGAEGTDQTLTYLSFGDIEGDGKLAVRSQWVSGVSAEPRSVPFIRSETSQTLIVGAWYELTTDALFADGPGNDVVRYELRDDTGDLIWESMVGSWEAAYIADGFSGAYLHRPVQGYNIIGNRVTMRPTGFTGEDDNLRRRLRTVPVNNIIPGGFYVDDVSATTWDRFNPKQPLFCWSTSFETLPDVVTPTCKFPYDGNDDN